MRVPATISEVPVANWTVTPGLIVSVTPKGIVTAPFTITVPAVQVESDVTRPETCAFDVDGRKWKRRRERNNEKCL
jgi:hypothetical protein